jgi:hypothetical protein
MTTTNSEIHTEPDAEKAVHIVVNRRPLTLHTVEVSGAELLDLAGFEGTQWDLLEIDGEHDPTGGTVILADQELTLKDGEQFRVVPGNRTFGTDR